MHKRLGNTKTLLVLFVATILSAVPFSATLADDHSPGQSMEEKLAQLEADLLGLRGLVKALTADIQKVADESNIDFSEFQPRIHTVEKVSEENSFEVKILKGTVAELVSNVQSLEELRPHIYQAKTTLGEIKAYFKENAEVFETEIESNEDQIDALGEELRKAMIIVGVLDEQIAPVSVRLDMLSERVELQGAEADALQAGIEHVAGNYAQSTGMINEHIAQLDEQINQLQKTLEEANRVSEFAAEIEVQISELIVRSTETETTTQELSEFLADFEKFDREAQDMRGQIEQIGAQIVTLARQAEENSSTIEANSARIDRLQQMRESMQGEGGTESRLEQKINEAFVQFSATQDALDALQASVANTREEIKREVLRDIPRIPTTDEIVVQIQESAAAQIQEANARADQAQNVALIALITGLSAIAVSLLL